VAVTIRRGIYIAMYQQHVAMSKILSFQKSHSRKSAISVTPEEDSQVAGSLVYMHAYQVEEAIHYAILLNRNSSREISLFILWPFRTGWG